MPHRSDDGTISMHVVRRGALALVPVLEVRQHVHPRDVSGTGGPSGLDRLGAGSLFITDGATRHHAIVTEECEVVSLSVQAQAFPAGVRAVLDEPVTVAQATPLSLGIGEFLASAVETQVADLSGAQRHFLERMLREMTMTLVAGSAGPLVPPRQDRTFPAALAAISVRCTDQELSLASIADDVNVSVRQLGRVFSGHGTTVGSEIRRARIDRAMRMLSSADFDGVSIDQIAKLSGFARGSSLARAMDAVGAGTPSQVRAART